MYYLRNRFAKKSLEVLIPYKNTLGLRLGPRKDLGPCNVVLGVRLAAVRWNSGELVACLGRRSSGGGPRGHTDAIWGWRKGGSGAGERASRHQAAAVAASSPPARLGLGHDRTRLGTLKWRRGERLGVSVRGRDGRRRRRHTGRVGGHCGVREAARRVALIAREREGSQTL
jgi:hypothetical protein